MTPTSCASCGAALRTDADACDLCGTPAAVAANGPTCGACGHTSPPGSRFCNQCGRALQPARPDQADEPAPVASERPGSDAGRRALLVAAAGIAVVVGLYALTAWSGGRDVPAAEAVAPAAPIADAAPPLPDTLQAAADRFAALGTASGWYESGRYYLTAAFNAGTQDPTSSVQWARRAVTSFEQSLALQDDPDVRVALAEAAAFDPATPMRPVTELQAVLAEYPDHVPANFEMGERRLLIGRLDSARVSFERVRALTEPGDPFRTQAEAALAAVESAARQPGG